MKQLILITAMTLSFSVAAEVFSEPVTMPNEPQQKSEDIGVTSSPIKAPDSQTDSGIFSASMETDSEAGSATPIEVEAPTPLPLPSLSSGNAQATSLQVIMIPDTETKDVVQVGSMDISGNKEISQESTSPIYSLKLGVVGTEKNRAYVSINLSQRGMKKINGKEFVTNYFMRDILTVGLDKPSQFNIGKSAILFSPLKK